MWGGGAHYTAPLLRAAGGGRRTGGGASESRTLCDKQIRVDLLGGGGHRGLAQRSSARDGYDGWAGLLGRAAGKWPGRQQRAKTKGMTCVHRATPGERRACVAFSCQHMVLAARLSRRDVWKQQGTRQDRTHDKPAPGSTTLTARGPGPETWTFGSDGSAQFTASTINRGARCITRCRTGVG